MTTNREPAKIYQFPVGGRRGGSRPRVMDASIFPATQVAGVAMSGNWYHEEAIRDDERARKTVHRLPTRQ